MSKENQPMAKQRERVEPLPEEQQLPPIPAIRRDTVGLRTAMFEEMDALRNGRSSAVRASAFAKLGNTIIESVRMEMEVRRFLQAAPVRIPEEPLRALGVPINLTEEESLNAKDDLG